MQPSRKLLFLFALPILLSACSLNETNQPPHLHDQEFPLVLDQDLSYVAYVDDVDIISIQYALVNKGAILYDDPITMIVKVNDEELNNWVAESEVNVSSLLKNNITNDPFTTFRVNDPQAFGVTLNVISDNIDIDSFRDAVEQRQGLMIQILDPDTEEILYSEAITRSLIVDSTGEYE